MISNEYWQNEAQELRAKVEELKKKIEAVHMGYGLILSRIEDLKDHHTNRFNNIEKIIEKHSTNFGH